MQVINTIQKPIMEFSWTGATVFWCLILLGALGFIGYWFIRWCNEDNSGWGGALLTFAILCAIVIAIVSAIGTAPTGEYKTSYQVLIDDSIPFVEIYEKYDIIDHQGLIYTIQERK